MPVIKNKKADLRARYSRHLKVSFILSLSLLIAAFKFSPQSEGETENVLNTQELIKIEDVINTVQKNIPPKLPEPPRIIETIDDELSDDFILEDTDLDINANVDDPPVRPDLLTVDDSDEEFYDFPHQLPEPIGGLHAIQEKVYYTEIAKLAGIEGTVVIQALIDKKGNVIEAGIIKSIGGGLDEISLAAVKQTKFSPGLQRGKPVNVKMIIPVKFVLK